MAMLRQRAETALRWVWPFALWVGLFLATGAYGFNPTDEGYLLAQSQRLLRGEVMHRDFISPRPVGSPLLHVVDFAVPLPLLDASRLITLAEVIGTSILFTWFIFGVSPRRWRVWQVAAAVGSVVVSLHAFPLTAWHTIDGLLLIAAGLVLVVRVERRGTTAVGLVLLGAAVIVKQSFFLAPVIGIVLAVVRDRKGGPLKQIVTSTAWAAIVPVVYVAVVAGAGGFGSMRRQLLGAGSPDLHSLTDSLRYGHGVAALVIAEIGLLAIFTVLQRADERARLAAFGAGVAVSAAVVWAAIGGRLVMSGVWGYELFWLLVVIVGWRLVANRVFDWVAFVMLLVAWMVTLSWGYVVPNLAGGALALAALNAVWSDYAKTGPIRLSPAVATAAALVPLVALPVLSVRDRRLSVYRDRPASELSYSLNRVAPDFGVAKTNPQTGAYLDEIARCVRMHPAREVAVLPDNAALYPIFGWRNPFPIDWMTPPEFGDEKQRLIDAATALRHRGDYVVLLQHQSAEDLARKPRRAESDPIFFYNHPALLHAILAALDGNVSSCGPFTVVTP